MFNNVRVSKQTTDGVNDKRKLVVMDEEKCSYTPLNFKAATITPPKLLF